MLIRSPSAEEREQHRQALKSWLRIMRLLNTQVADPDFPDKALKDMLAVQVWKLEESWSAIYEPMDDVETDRILQEVFPDTPRT